MKTLRHTLAALVWLAGAAAACAPQPKDAEPANAPGQPQAEYGQPPAPAPPNVPAPNKSRYSQPVPVPGGPVPGSDGVEAINTVEEAEAALAAAEREMGAVFGSTKVEALGVDRCARSCKALGSMQRAVDRLCDLTDGDDRCEQARSRVERSRKRVTDAGCAC